MKTFQIIRKEQAAEVRRYQKLVKKIVAENIRPYEGIVGALLGGSVARGDARKGPFGLRIDLVIVVEKHEDVDLDKLFGPDTEPGIPYHCTPLADFGLQIEVTTKSELENIRSCPESTIFARQESEIIFDPTGYLREWKKTIFIIADVQRRDRALKELFRFQYLTGEYRYEKWSYRTAWTQLAQIAFEAAECFCTFLFCINGRFIPRRDCMVYLTYELPTTVPDHERVMEMLYTSGVTKSAIRSKFLLLREVGVWMKSYCTNQHWLGGTTRV